LIKLTEATAGHGRIVPAVDLVGREGRREGRREKVSREEEAWKQGGREGPREGGDGGRGARLALAMW